jgi:Virulence protein
LSEDELDTLNRMVTLFLDTAELRVKEQIPLSLSYWAAEADSVIRFSRKPLLDHTGKVSHEEMKQIATRQYEVFDAQRKKTEALESDKQEQKAIEELIKKAKKK